MKRVAIFVSGTGTNMENLIRKIQGGKVPGVEPALVISDNPGAGALEKAKRLGVEVSVLDRKRFESKEAFERAVLKKLEESKIDFICLAGFMRILSPAFVERYSGRLLNIHPALLPAFPGAHAIQDAFEAKVKETGVTVHFVDSGVDTGPVILQRKVPVSPQDTLETLEAKVHAAEYEAYPEALRLVVTGQIKLPQHHHDDEFWTKD